MRTLAVILILIALAAAVACKRPRHIRPAATVEEPGDLASRVNLADPNAGSQILNGFYGVESGAWRWSMKRFAVSLQPPPEAGSRGAVLEMKFSAPHAIWDKLGPVTIQASVAGRALQPFPVSQPGEQVFRAAVPPGALSSEPVIAMFILDKAYRAGNDSRELGIIVSEIGFAPAPTAK